MKSVMSIDEYFDKLKHDLEMRQLAEELGE